MAETITITGGRKHKWNKKLRGQKLVRLTVPTSELNLAGVLQWVEGMIYAKNRGYDKVVK